MARKRKSKSEYLYGVMRVPCNASEEQLKKAHRQRSMETHPDRGGNREEFEQVQQAWRVLSDPARRKHYDETGEVKDKEPNQGEMEALGIIGRVLESLLVAPSEITDQALASQDLVSKILEVIDNQIGSLTEQISIAQRALKRIDLLAGRFSTEGEQDNVIKTMLEARKAGFEERIKKMIEGKEHAKRAKEIVSRHKYRYEKLIVKHVGTFRTVGSYGTTSSTNIG